MSSPTLRADGSDARMALARWVSIVAHPFAITLLLVGAVELRRGWPAALRSVTIVAVLFVLPLAVVTGRQVRRGAWETVDASRPSERPLLYLIGGGGLVLLLGYLWTMERASPLLRGAAGTLGMVVACALITRWVKVSLHTAVASLAATVLVIVGSPAGWPLALVLPVLAWSRVTLGRHRWIEVALGLAVGFVTGHVIVRL